MEKPTIGSDCRPLKEMGEIFESMVEHAPIGTLLVDAAGIILHSNPQTEQILGYASSELLGQPMEILLPERFHGIHEAHRDGFMADPRARQMGVGRHLFARHKSGREIPVEIGLVPMKISSGMTVLATIVDVTAQQEVHSVDLEQRGLGWSLKDMIAHVQETSAIRCRFEGDENLTILDRDPRLKRLRKEALDRLRTRTNHAPEHPAAAGLPQLGELPQSSSSATATGGGFIVL